MGAISKVQHKQLSVRHLREMRAAKREHAFYIYSCISRSYAPRMFAYCADLQVGGWSDCAGVDQAAEDGDVEGRSVGR